MTERKALKFTKMFLASLEYQKEFGTDYSPEGHQAMETVYNMALKYQASEKTKGILESAKRS